MFNIAQTKNVQKPVGKLADKPDGKLADSRDGKLAICTLAILIPIALASCTTLRELREPKDQSVAPAPSTAVTLVNAKPVVEKVAEPVVPSTSAANTATSNASAVSAAPSPVTNTAPPAPASATPANTPVATTKVMPKPLPVPNVPNASNTPDAASATPPQAARQANNASVQVGSDGSHIYRGTGQFVNQTPPAADAAKPKEEEFTLNYESLDIRAVVQSIMGEMLRESFTIHPLTAGTATIRYSKPIPKSELIPILETLLRQNGQIMVREDGIYKVMPQAIGVKGSVTPRIATTVAQLPTGFSVQLIQLKFAGVRDMQRLLEPYVTEPMSSVRTDELRNMMILSGTQRELKHMLELIELFDVDYLAGFSVGLFPMQTDVKSLTADLDRIFGGAATGSGGAPGGAASASVSPLAGIVRIIPVERLNGLLVITTQPKYLEEAKKWIDRLDKGGGLAGGMRLNVYPVQHGRADKLAQLLSDIYGKGGSGTSTGAPLAPGARPATTTTNTPGQLNQPGQQAQQGGFNAFLNNLFQSSGTAVSKDTRIIADNDNNALLILASPSDYETIVSALRQLDVPRRQVMVEVLVARVTLKDELKFGIEWFINARNNTRGALRNDLATTNSNSPLGSALPTNPQTLPGSTSGLQLLNFVGTDLRAVLQALGDDSRATVESAPKVLVLDNEKATVNVGTRISVDTGSTTSSGSNTVTTKQYVDTGILLTVTPRINAGGRVTLDINQEVSSATSSSSNPDIATTKAQTVVNVASGQTMALAGLITKDNSNSSYGLPLISKIPIIGGLFGSQGYTRNRTELVILITPSVVNNDDDARQLNDELRKKLPELGRLLPKRVDAPADVVREK